MEYKVVTKEFRHNISLTRSNQTINDFSTKELFDVSRYEIISQTATTHRTNTDLIITVTILLKKKS